MERYLREPVQRDLAEKVVLIGGPRQSGKTTLAKALLERYAYFNYDSEQDRRIIRHKQWPRDVPVVIFDELHKMRQWKRWLKGVYDTEPRSPSLLVTGSARLDVYKKGGDSMAGRFFYFRLHPLSIAEAHRYAGEDPGQALDKLCTLGGFPEPYLKDSEKFAKRWRRSHLDRILREDLLDLSAVRDLRAIELLVDLLAERVGGLISYASLAEDLQVSPHTIKHWIAILESLFVVFIVTPYSKRIERGLLKQPKIYFYDTGRVVGGDAARFENVIACALLKHSHYREDVFGETRRLHYLRDKEKREVDFVTVLDNRVEWLIEAKSAETEPHRALAYYAPIVRPERCLQLVRNAKRRTQAGAIHIEPAAPWLAGLES